MLSPYKVPTYNRLTGAIHVIVGSIIYENNTVYIHILRYPILYYANANLPARNDTTKTAVY